MIALRAATIRVSATAPRASRLAAMAAASTIGAFALPAMAEHVQAGVFSLQAMEAGQMFRYFCIDTLPDFAAANDRITARGDFQIDENGVHVHPTLFLSVYVVPGASGGMCSFGFQSTDTDIVTGKLTEVVRQIAADAFAATGAVANFNTDQVPGTTIHLLSILTGAY